MLIPLSVANYRSSQTDPPTSGFFMIGGRSNVVMSKTLPKEKITKKKAKRIESLSLEAINYQIILGGVVVIIAGYFALSAKPWDNPIAMNVAPILLVLGYCVIIPFGIIYRKKKSGQDSQETVAGQV